MFNGDAIGRGMDRMTIGEQGATGIQIFHIGENRAENEQAIGLVHEFFHFVAGHQSAIDPHVEWMVFTNDRLSQERGGDRNIEAFYELGQLVMEPEPPHFSPAKITGRFADSSIALTSAKASVRAAWSVGSSCTPIEGEVAASGTCTMSRGISR